jgi:hypothetical protein
MSCGAASRAITVWTWKVFLGFSRRCKSPPGIVSCPQEQPGVTMGHRFRLAAIAMAVAAAGACATEMSAAGAKVRIVRAHDVVGYEFVGQVTGSSMLGGEARQLGFQNALNDMLDKAGAMGATHVVITYNPGPVYWTWSQTVRGEAYKAGN